jgi:hypothetical protein
VFTRRTNFLLSTLGSFACHSRAVLGAVSASQKPRTAIAHASPRSIAEHSAATGWNHIQTVYPLTERDQGHLVAKRKVHTLTGQVEVEVPEKGDDRDELVEHEGDQLEPNIAPESGKPDDAGVRQSIQIQAQIAEIGAKMDTARVGPG